MEKTEFDTIVIGAGSGGLSYAQTAAELGASVLIVERAHLGGTCVNRGCVPKKILWAAGNHQIKTRGAADAGIATKAPLDYPALIERRDAHIGNIRASFEDSLREEGITLIRGKATLASGNTVQVDGTDFTANHVVIATGGRPSKMDIPGAEYLSDSNDVLSWTNPPKSIVIIGGGYIGCEFAAIFNALGTSVVLVHDGPHILDTFPGPLARHAQATMIEAGITVLLDDAVARVEKSDGDLAYTTSAGITATADAVVCAVGRTPNIDQLGAFAADLTKADNGTLAITDSFETSTPGVYAIGDVADRLPLTPVATADGASLAQILFGKGSAPVDLNLVATTAFLYPPAAFVGDCDDVARLSGMVTPLEANVMFPTSESDPDFYEISVDTETQMIKGAAIAGGKAEDLIALSGALIAANARTDVLRTATPVHPSFAEEFFGRD